MKLQELIEAFTGYEDVEITFSDYSDLFDNVGEVRAILVKEANKDAMIVLVEK